MCTVLVTQSDLVTDVITTGSAHGESFFSETRTKKILDFPPMALKWNWYSYLSWQPLVPFSDYVDESDLISSNLGNVQR